MQSNRPPPDLRYKGCSLRYRIGLACQSGCVNSERLGLGYDCVVLRSCLGEIAESPVEVDVINRHRAAYPQRLLRFSQLE